MSGAGQDGPGRAAPEWGLHGGRGPWTPGSGHVQQGELGGGRGSGARWEHSEEEGAGEPEEGPGGDLLKRAAPEEVSWKGRHCGRGQGPRSRVLRGLGVSRWGASVSVASPGPHRPAGGPSHLRTRLPTPGTVPWEPPAGGQQRAADLTPSPGPRGPLQAWAGQGAPPGGPGSPVLVPGPTGLAARSLREGWRPEGLSRAGARQLEEGAQGVEVGLCAHRCLWVCTCVWCVCACGVRECVLCAHVCARVCVSGASDRIMLLPTCPPLAPVFCEGGRPSGEAQCGSDGREWGPCGRWGGVLGRWPSEVSRGHQPVPTELRPRGGPGAQGGAPPHGWEADVAGGSGLPEPGACHGGGGVPPG